MARARNIKPGFYKNEDLAECSVWARFIFPGLWMLADREGRLEDRPKRIKAELLAFDSHDVEPLLKELETHKFLVRYENEDGRFIQITKFNTNQTPHYSEKKSVIKAPILQETKGDDEQPKPELHQDKPKKLPPIKRGSQPPDSLNPYSLTPDSLNPEIGSATTYSPEPTPEVIHSPPEKLAVVDPITYRAIELAILLKRGGASLTGSDPNVRKWAMAGISDAQALTALEKATANRAATCSAQPINSGYLDSIISNPDAKPAEPKRSSKGPPWWTSNELMEAKAKAIGIKPPKPGETWEGFRGRINAKLAEAERAET